MAAPNSARATLQRSAVSSEGITLLHALQHVVRQFIVVVYDCFCVVNELEIF